MASTITTLLGHYAPWADTPRPYMLLVRNSSAMRSVTHPGHQLPSHALLGHNVLRTDVSRSKLLGHACASKPVARPVPFQVSHSSVTAQTPWPPIVAWPHLPGCYMHDLTCTDAKLLSPTSSDIVAWLGLAQQSLLNYNSSTIMHKDHLLGLNHLLFSKLIGHC